MDFKPQNQSRAAPRSQQIDFGAQAQSQAQNQKGNLPQSHVTPSPQITSPPITPPLVPTPRPQVPSSQVTKPPVSTPSTPTAVPSTKPSSVSAVATSAKAAINAMYAQQANQPRPHVVTSAREAVNAAAQQATASHTKSAANLHHGSIQRSMESTRTSASALLRRAEDDTKIQTHAGSLDPLAKVRPTSSQKRPEREVPVVRTSLKLGAAARPKPAPVVLPPNARMAKIARPVDSKPSSATTSPSKLSRLLRRNMVEAQVTPRKSLKHGAKTKVLASGQSQPSQETVKEDNALTVKIIPSSTPAPAPVTPKAPRRKVSAARDPQMVAGARRTLKARAQGLAQKAQTAEALGMVTTAQSSRFRIKPKGFSAKQPAAMSADNSYVMAEPPKLTQKKASPAPEELGVIESYHPQNPPQPIGDKTPINRLKAQQVASGHVGAAPNLPGVKADNTSNYSFSKKKTEPNNNRYALGGESPFLKSVNVEKRPLSYSAKKLNPKVEHKAIEPKSTPKTSRKNHYPKKSASKSASVSRQELPIRPTVIVPSNRRSKAPLFFLVLLTIILGASVGAAAYLCFFQ